MDRQVQFDHTSIILQSNIDSWYHSHSTSTQEGHLVDLIKSHETICVRIKSTILGKFIGKKSWSVENFICCLVLLDEKYNMLVVGDLSYSIEARTAVEMVSQK